MALRVLLADESSTIKKVFQLALQDFAVDVRPVNIGVDVLAIAKTFKPDIIFADVLLQKKNGYEVSSDIKGDSSLVEIPVVLMWSGFMEMDEDKFQASQANGRLEKPFDVAALRRLVTDLVPKTQTQRLSQFLTFPNMPEMQESPAPAPPSEDHGSEEEFQQVSIPKMKSGADRFRINLESELESDLPVALNMSSEPIDIESIFREADEPEEFTVRDTKSTPPPVQAQAPGPSVTATPPPIRASATAKPPPLAPPMQSIEMRQPTVESRSVAPEIRQSPVAAAPPAATTPQPVAPAAQPVAPAAQPIAPARLSEAQIEDIIRKQAKEIIEATVWKVLPELAQQIIEREIQKLLKEKDAGTY